VRLVQGWPISAASTWGTFRRARHAAEGDARIAVTVPSSTVTLNAPQTAEMS
jgi:hypothetical protein